MKTLHYLGHTLVPQLFTEGGIALDCGSNNGNFAQWLSQQSTMQIFSFEADPRLYQRLPQVDRVRFLPMAVAGRSGTLELGLGQSNCSSMVFRESANQSTVMVKATSLDDFCAEQGIEKISFIKMDIEGSELDVLATMSPELLGKTQQITVEFHDVQRPEDIPRIRAVINRLQDLGFYYLCLSHYTWGDCLFINENTRKLTVADKLSLQLFGKYLPGAKRIFNRLIRR